jgi:2-polyprenyl-3-methyl-5-hydroxy-6-metoxy-1,4-benzoquinol methylase
MILPYKKKGANRKNRNDKKKETIVSCIKTIGNNLNTKDMKNDDIKQEYKYDRIIISEVIHKIKDYLSFIEMIMKYIAVKGVIVICYEKKMKNLDTFFDTIMPLFHSHELHTVEIYRKSGSLKNISDIHNNDCKNRQFVTYFNIHILRAKISNFH